MLSFFVYFDFNIKLVDLLMWKNWYIQDSGLYVTFFFTFLLFSETNFWLNIGKVIKTPKEICPAHNARKVAQLTQKWPNTCMLFINVVTIYEFWPIMCNLGNFCQHSVDREEASKWDFLMFLRKCWCFWAKITFFELLYVLFLGTSFWLNIGKVT